ncbi:hypothetical protein Tco_1452899 [Tanacetum coccineum]
MKKAFQDMMHGLWGKLIQLMHTIMIPEQVKTMKIQAVVQGSRPEDTFSFGSAFEDFICVVIKLVRNIVSNSVCLVLHQMTSDHNRSELGIQDHSNEQSSSKLVPKVVPLAVKTATSRQELELLFHHHIAMLRTTGK